MTQQETLSEMPIADWVEAAPEFILPDLLELLRATVTQHSEAIKRLELRMGVTKRNALKSHPDFYHSTRNLRPRHSGTFSIFGRMIDAYVLIVSGGFWLTDGIDSAVVTVDELHQLLDAADMSAVVHQWREPYTLTIRA